MNKLLTGICLDLLPDSVDMTDLRSLFKSFFEVNWNNKFNLLFNFRI